MNKVCIYLRKSRADEELEKTLGQGETLSKHRKALLKYAKEHELNIVEIKEEIVSGESLFFRPKMLELLKEVEAKTYSGVLVMDMQRLGRGDMKDQGVILETFKNSKTKIITPMKTYDLNNDFDEEYSEFEAFMSRKELKMINRRMQGGRVRSVEDGNYIATNPPIGYDIDYIKKSRTLKINEEESEIIKLIFKLYTEGSGSKNIADYLNSLGYKTKIGNNFSASSVLTILKNPIYIGKITWKKKDIRKSKTPGKLKDTKMRDKSEWIIVDGKHKPLIDKEIWNKSQEILNNRYHVPYQLTNAPINPFAGLITCAVCGKKMTMRPSRGIHRIMCTYKCGNISNRFDDVELEVLNQIEKVIEGYRYELESNEPKDDETSIFKGQLANITKEIKTLENQKLKLFDFLERGIYTEEVFLDRSTNIANRINLLTSEKNSIENKLNSKSTSKNLQDAIIDFEAVVKSYPLITDVKLKNELLKSILNKIEYKKTNSNSFEIKIYIK
ncbi:MAG: recombinase family protein [Clostridium chrysemydis]|uniref:recombinase family protein n=1 Tax=Clostridium chrysemydis TaxID=2665504 RepID=UPI003F351368